MCHLCNDILFELNTEGNLTIYNNIVNTGGHYAKWNKPIRGKPIFHDFAYTCLYLRLQMELILVVNNHKNYSTLFEWDKCNNHKSPKMWKWSHIMITKKMKCQQTNQTLPPLKIEGCKTRNVDNFQQLRETKKWVLL